MHTQTHTAGVLEDRDHAGRGQTRMFTNKTTARIVGALFIIGTLAGATSAVALTPLIDAPDVLRAVAESPDRALLGASLILVMGFALALIPLVVYPILKADSEPLALGYVVFRGGLETVTYLASALVWVVLLSLGREYVDAEGSAATLLEAVGAAILEVNDAVGDVALTFVFALGAMMFYYVLFRARLVPRWLSGWGLLAALLWVAAGVLTMFGFVDPRSTAQIAMALPIAIHEMVLAGWLIIKGFDARGLDRSAIGHGSERALSAPVTQP